MTQQELIAEVESIVAHRISGPATVGDKWITWPCTKSPQTMSKFVGRVQSSTGQAAFCRNGTFGVLAGE